MVVSILKNLLEGEIKYPDEEINKWVSYLEIYKKRIIDFLTTARYDTLYKGKIHGMHHSEKVLFFSLILANKFNLEDNDIKLIMDASFYHDIGRSTDAEDSFHGWVGCEKIDDIIKDDPFYRDKENFYILKGMIDAHSLSDERMDISLSYDEIKNKDRAILLTKILKDADALDRKRFNDVLRATLNSKYLRLNESIELIGFAKRINNLYKEFITTDTKNISQAGAFGQNKTKSDCFHSIGFDFFKIESILQNGILSATEMKKQNITTPRNFEGGNTAHWISVVDSKEIPLQEGAYQNFTLHGINFYCLVSNMQLPLSASEREIAIEKGLPFDKSGYKDEKYVYHSIEPNDIIAIMIPEQYKNASIKDLNYIYNSLSKELITSRIKYYLDKTKDVLSTSDYNVLFSSLANYCQLLDTFQELSPDELVTIENKIPLLLERERLILNKNIANLVYKYYYHLLGQDEITVENVVLYELSKIKKDLKIITTDNEMVISLVTKEKALR